MTDHYEVRQARTLVAVKEIVCTDAYDAQLEFDRAFAAGELGEYEMPNSRKVQIDIMPHDKNCGCEGR